MKRQAFIVLMLTSTVVAEDWTVEMDGTGDFDSIQAAVDAASDGDVILIGPGVWTSDSAPGIPVVDVFEKSVSLQSVAGFELTIIDGEQERPCLFILNEDTKQSAMTVEGITFINGVSEGSLFCGGGVSVLGATVNMSNCYIENCVSEYHGGGLFAWQATMAIQMVAQPVISLLATTSTATTPTACRSMRQPPAVSTAPTSPDVSPT